jgi:hypothetical protein
MTMNDRTKKVIDRMDAFAKEEGEWIDNEIRELYPKWLILLAESAANARIKILAMALSKLSGFSIQRNQDTVILNNGRAYIVKAITTTIKRFGHIHKVRKFDNLNIVIDEKVNNFLERKG